MARFLERFSGLSRKGVQALRNLLLMESWHLDVGRIREYYQIHQFWRTSDLSHSITMKQATNSHSELVSVIKANVKSSTLQHANAVPVRQFLYAQLFRPINLQPYS